MEKCGNNDNDKAMTSILHVLFKKGTPQDTFHKEIMKHNGTSAKVLDTHADKDGQGYIILVPDSLVDSITLRTDNVEAVLAGGSNVSPVGRKLVWETHYIEKIND